MVYVNYISICLKVINLSMSYFMRKNLSSLLATAELIQFIIRNSNSPIWNSTKDRKLLFVLDARKAYRLTLSQQDYLHETVSNMEGVRKYNFNLL